MIEKPWRCRRCKSEIGTIRRTSSGARILLIKRGAVTVEIDSGSVVCENCGAKRKFIIDPQRLQELLYHWKK